jgi:hypothetical protein
VEQADDDARAPAAAGMTPIELILLHPFSGPSAIYLRSSPAPSPARPERICEDELNPWWRRVELGPAADLNATGDGEDNWMRH